MSESTERMRRKRERDRLAEQDAGTPWEGLVGEERERAIRDDHGYAPSETRSQAERQPAVETPTAEDEERREKLYQLGYEKQPCPIPVEDMSLHGKNDTAAWAQGVWKRQAEEQRQLRERKAAEAVEHGYPAPISEELRARRAAAYRAWELAGKPSGSGWQAIKEQLQI